MFNRTKQFSGFLWKGKGELVRNEGSISVGIFISLITYLFFLRGTFVGCRKTLVTASRFAISFAFFIVLVRCVKETVSETLYGVESAYQLIRAFQVGIFVIFFAFYMGGENEKAFPLRRYISPYLFL